MSTAILEAASDTAAGTRHIEVDFLYVDLNTCTRCLGTDANLEEALAWIIHKRPSRVARRCQSGSPG